MASHSLFSQSVLSGHRRSRNYGPEELIPGLTCSYGTFNYARMPTTFGQAPPQVICHTVVGQPEERAYCERCGGDYCPAHADPAAHECALVILPLA